MKKNIAIIKNNHTLLIKLSQYHSPKVRTLKPAKPNMVIGPHID